ncbi:MAG: pilus assembly protein N-terminal domain-containing protein [Rhodobacteraceae bacterium]|nr:pilus assembly protein N-terminal domain-containing protein [Paracoccaceae bacterium]
MPIRNSMSLPGAVVFAALFLQFGPASAEDVNVMVDRAKVFRIEDGASTVIVGNPFIADVAMHDKNTVVVTGKAYGTTNIIILNAQNEPIIDELIVVQAPEDNTVSVTRKTDRTSYSCTPNCESTLRLGDSPESFSQVADQSTQRNNLAVQASGN